MYGLSGQGDKEIKIDFEDCIVKQIKLLKLEKFKAISGYGGLYEISNFGRVKSIGYSTIRILKPRIDTNGYLQVVLSKNKKEHNCSIHRLVSLAFILNPENYLQINHKDGNKQNNRIDNLEWCSCRYNINYYHKNQDTSSKYSGVCWDKGTKKWKAKFSISGKTIYLGIFDSEIEAAEIYEKAVLELTT